MSVSPTTSGGEAKTAPGFSCFTNLVADRIFYRNTMQFGRTEQQVKPGATAPCSGVTQAVTHQKPQDTGDPAGYCAELHPIPD